MEHNEAYSDGERTRKGQRQRSGKITEKGLSDIALNYLTRYSATKESLRKVLMRRIEFSAKNYGTDPNVGATWVDALIGEYQRLGYLNDRKYAESRVRTLLEKGKSTRSVVMLLRGKGISQADIESTLEVARNELSDLDLYAAIALARRRRLGPYSGPDTRQDRRENDLAILARAGFNYEVSRRIIDSKSQKEIDSLFPSDDLDDRSPYTTNREFTLGRKGGEKPD